MNIGFIGTGQMGSRMARRLLDAGHDLTVYDIRMEATRPLLEKGAKWLDTPGEIAKSCPLVITMVPGPVEVEQVVYGSNGLMAGWKKGDIYLDMSTSLPGTTRKVAKDARPKGVTVIDAPVTGGIPGAEAGTLTIMVGGSAEDLARVSGILQHIGKTILHMGDTGCGNVTKIVNNLIALTCMNVSAEAFVLGVKAGVDASKLFQAVTSGSGNNRQLENLFPRTIFQGNFEPGFELGLALKDVSLATTLARELNVSLPIGTTVEQRLIECQASGLAKKSMAACILPLEKLAGVKVRAPKK